MSSEGDSPSAPPFDTSNGHLTDGTIVSVGEEPKYLPRKGKVLPPSLAYHPSTSSSSKNTEYGSFEDEEFDDDVAIFWPQTNITAVNAIEKVINMGLTQEQKAAEVRASAKQRLEALKERAEKASTSKGKRLVKEGKRAPKRSKPSSASQRDTRRSILHSPGSRRVPDGDNRGRFALKYDLCRRSREDATSSKIRLLAKEGKGGTLLEERTAHVFLGVPEDAYISDIPSVAYAIARGSTLPADAVLIDNLPLESAFITGLSAGVQAQLIQAEKAEAKGRAASEQFKSLQAEVLRLGKKVEGWLDKCREQNEEADRLREEIEWYRACESKVVRLREEKDEEIARLRAELEVYKEEAGTAVENFKNSNYCRKMIYDHGIHLYANGWVGCRVWLKERNPYLDISEAKWASEEEAYKEERLAKMLAEAEVDMEEGSEDEGAAEREG
ncbi:hypothetical protein O6P43_001940 [Quillaja saponaria]|uniref:Uncharacterized protein n=1 Tax=Quillaja saponaria TaxID=32244 RepID=A0AAD7QBM6_QUISA|nr:hypothetical protein O6P43_001940 [Quillaja saponaria]